MRYDLFINFERLLDEEALRLMSENQKKIYKKLKKEFKYYWIDIELRIYRFNFLKSDGVIIDIENNNYLNQINYLNNYYQKCINFCTDKDHLVAARNIAKKLIDYYYSNPDNNKCLTEFIANKMDEFFPTHHDSIDSRTVALFLQKEIENLGFDVTSINPIRLNKRK